MNIVEPIRKKTDLKKIEKILKKNGLRDLLIFTIGTNCGLRISDILNLNVGDVRNKTYINIIEKKTSKPKRFPINSKLKPMLEKFTQDRNVNEPLFKSIFTDFKIVSTKVEHTKLNLVPFFVFLPNKEYKRLTKLYFVFSLFLI